jgi:hypothetical protein
MNQNSSVSRPSSAGEGVRKTPTANDSLGNNSAIPPDGPPPRQRGSASTPEEPRPPHNPDHSQNQEPTAPNIRTGFTPLFRRADTGLLKDIDPSEPDALLKVNKIIKDNELVPIGNGNRSVAYDLPENKSVLKIPLGGTHEREKNFSDLDIKATEAAARLGVGAKVDWTQSTYSIDIDGREGPAFLVQARASGDTLAKISNNLSDKRRKAIAKNLMENVATHNKHGWIHPSMHENNFVISEANKVVMIDIGGTSHIKKPIVSPRTGRVLTQPAIQYGINSLRKTTQILKPTDMDEIKWDSYVRDIYI